MSMFVPSKMQGGKAAAGAKPWKTGERLWDLHMSAPKLLTRNLASVVRNEEGVTNAGTLGLTKPEHVLDAALFSDQNMQAQRTELLNRPAVGISMLAGSLQALRVNLQEGLAQGVYGKAFVDSYEDLCRQYDLEGCNRSVNLQDFPDLERSGASIAAAVKRLLKLGTKIQEKWAPFAEFTARSATAYVGMQHLLQLGALTLDGKAAQGIKDLPAEGSVKAAQEALTQDPSNPEKLVAFFTAAVTERHETSTTKKASRSGQASAKKLVIMKMSPSPARLTTEEAGQVNLFVEQLVSFDATAGSAKASLAALVDAINNASQAVWDEVEAHFNIQDKVTELTQEIKAHRKSQPAAASASKRAAAPEASTQKKRRKN